MFRQWALIVVLLCVFADASTSLATDGIFFALENTNGDDRLYRIDVDADFSPTVTAIGVEGAFGFPEVEGLIWDPSSERLFAYDRIFGLWLEIDVLTSETTVLGDFPFTTEGMTYNSNDGFVYALIGGEVYRINQNTGETSFVFDPGPGNRGLAHVLNGVGGLDGIYHVKCNNLTFFPEPDWKRFDLGGDVCGRDALIWDSTTDTLFNYTAYTVNQWFVVNQVTGNEELFANWSNIGIEVIAITFVPSRPSPPVCDRMDTDDDGDIDLVDFAEWQNCFTGAIGDY